MSQCKYILYLTLTLILLTIPLFSVSAQTTRTSQLLNVITSLQNLLANLQAELNSLGPQTQLAQVAPTTNLVAHYTFDDQANPGRDDSGNNNTGTLTPAVPNGPTWVTGTDAKVGNGALQFDGLDDNVDVGDLTVIEGIDNATWSMWVKPNSLAFEQAFFGKYDGTYGYNSLIL